MYNYRFDKIIEQHENPLAQFDTTLKVEQETMLISKLYLMQD
jgi:hypothetical protein